MEEVVSLWDQTFDSIDPEDDPIQVLVSFIRKKVEFTRLYPEATRIFTNEVLHGNPHMSHTLNHKMSQWTRDRAEVIENWVMQKKIRPVDPYHLIFMIWATTQYYAFAEAQIKSVYQKPELTHSDYAGQADSLTLMLQRIYELID